MGLAASQARALLLVARKSDLEYRSQCISQRKLVLSQQTEQIAREYSNKISNRKLRFTYNLSANDGKPITEDLQYSSLGAQNAKFVGEYRLLNNRGDIVVASVNEIPKVKKSVEIYTVVDSSGQQVTTPQKIHPEVEMSSLGKEMALFVQGADGEFVQIQDSNGKANTNATIKVNSSNGYIEQKVYSGTDADGKPILSSDIKKLYTENTVNEPVTTDNQNMQLQDGQKLVVSGYKTVEVPAEQLADGYYHENNDPSGRKYIVCPEVNSTSYFQNGLRTGAFIIQKATPVEVKDSNNIVKETRNVWEETPWQGSDIIQDVLDTSDDAIAESEYESKLAVIKAQDQMLDMELKQVETQHKAIETEMDSVKKVIDSNIEKTFKIFA